MCKKGKEYRPLDAYKQAMENYGRDATLGSVLESAVVEEEKPSRSGSSSLTSMTMEEFNKGYKKGMGQV